jgi:hypothetical protein
MMYRLIMAYRAKGTVSSVEPQAMGRRKDAFVLDAKRERLIASAIHEIYLKPERPTLTFLIEQVRARCAQKNLPPPDRRTIKARVDCPTLFNRGLLDSWCKSFPTTASCERGADRRQRGHTWHA